MRKPPSPPDFWQHLAQNDTSPHQFFERIQLPEVKRFIQRANGVYMHWDKLRRYPMPAGINPIEMWGAVALSRTAQFQQIPLSLESGVPFKYWTPPQQQEWLHRIDQDAGGFIGSRSRIVPMGGDDRFLVNSLMEEAIASSQLEGASTTRAVAKKLLRSGRRPRDKHEQMILNNYNAILEIRDSKEMELTPEFLWHIHEVITDKTLSDPTAAGRFRNASDEPVHVVDGRTDEIIYEPPDVATIAWRIQELCDFANKKSEPFIHPVVKAIILHFAMGYIHPFVDGNGRTARAIFYWYMLKSGYWIFEFLPISRIVLDAPAKYARAYLYSETDNGDLTHFIQYHLKIIDRAVREMMEYFARQQLFMHEARELLNAYDLNHRQLAAAYYAIQHPETLLTFGDHAAVNGVSKATSRNDLLGLEELGVIERRKHGKSWAFAPTEMFRGSGGAFRKVRKRQSRKEVAITRQSLAAVESLPPAPPRDDQQIDLPFDS